MAVRGILHLLLYFFSYFALSLFCFLVFFLHILCSDHLSFFHAIICFIPFHVFSPAQLLRWKMPCVLFFHNFFPAFIFLKEYSRKKLHLIWNETVALKIQVLNNEFYFTKYKSCPFWQADLTTICVTGSNSHIGLHYWFWIHLTLFLWSEVKER